MTGLWLGVSVLFCFLAELAEASILPLSRAEAMEWKSTSLEKLIDDRKKLAGFFSLSQWIFTAAYFWFLGLASNWSGPVLVGGIVGYALLLRLFPRHLAQNHAKPLAKKLAQISAIPFKLLGWAAPALDGIAKILAGLFGEASGDKKPSLTAEEIKMLVNMGKEDQMEIEEEEKEMIESVVTFGQTLVKEIMTPRIDMICVEADTPVSGVLDTAISHGYSKFPVYEGTIDNIVGIIYAKDLFKLLRSGQNSVPLKSVLRKPFFVPESKKVDDLLRDMQREKISMAIVVDEYGGTDGLVTIEDLVEEIVGEIADEHDTELPEVLQLGENAWLIDGLINIEDLNDQLKLNLPTEEFETLGGYVYGLMGKVPKAGDKVTIEQGTLEVSVVHRQRISKVKFTRTPAADGEPSKKELS